MSEMVWRKMRNYMAMLEETTSGCPPEAEVYRKKLARVVRDGGDAKAIAEATPADVGECPNSYVFIVDMPGVKASEIRVEENGNVLMVSGERKRYKDHNKESKGERIKYVKVERIRKFTRKFGLPDNANVNAISALYEDGVLTVTVQKLPPPQPKRPKIIQVKAA